MPYAVALAVLLVAPPAAALTAGLGFSLGRVVTLIAILRYHDGWDEVWRMQHRIIGIVLTAGFSLTLVVGAVACGRDRGTGSAGPPSTPTRAETPTVHGVPAGFAANGDPQAVAAQEPHVANMPTTGLSVAYVREAGRPSQVWRIVVVLNPDQTPSLAGSEVTLPADWPGKGHQLVSDDSNTLYVISNTPSGRHWFLAVTGGSGADRFTAARDIVARTLNGP